MAELDVSDKGGKKTHSTRVDLTPMVDLGFLLITFFMFTTTMSKPKAMPYNTPFKDENLKEEDQNKIKESTVLTALLSKNHRVYTYRGIGSAENPPEIKVLHFGAGDGSFRDELISFRDDVESKKKSGYLNPEDKAVVIIKPDSNSTFKDLVDVLDELTINGVNTQATVDISANDRDYIHKTEVANGE